MAERIPAPADLAKTNWNSDGSTYPSTDPGSSKRATGFKPKDVPTPGAGEVIAANDQNWLHGLGMQMHTWLKQFVPREWTELSEGIANATVIRQLFRLCPAAASISSRGAFIYSTASVATGVGLVRDIVTDGLRVYYTGGTGDRYIVAVSPVDGQDGAGGGVPLWEINPHGVATPVGICTDGNYVFYSMSATVTGLQRVDAADGANLATAGAKVAHGKLVSNGINVSGVTGAGVVDSWNISTMTDNWTNNPSAGLAAVAIDEDTTYCGGTRNTNDVWAYANINGALTWQVTLDTNAPSVNDIAADGDFIYVGTDDFVTALPGTPNRCLFCLERVSGSVLWSMDLGVDVEQVVVDDEYIFALSAGASELYIIRKGMEGATIGGPGVVKVIANIGSYAGSTICCDGGNLWSHDALIPANLKRINTGGATKLFMRVSGSDPRRRPFYTLAIPVTGRT